MENYRTALEYYKKANNKSNEFWCYTGMGIVQKQVGNMQEAIVQYNHALNTAKSSGLKKEEAACWNNLGNVYRRQGDFTKAMESYQMAITVLQELKDDDAVSDCLNNIGNLYLDNGDPFRALDYYKQALITAEAKNDEYRLIIRYKNLAGAYSELKDYENATQYLNDAISLAEKSGDKSFIASCNMLFGKLQYTRGDLRIAIAYYEKSVGLYNETGAKDEEAEALVELALARLEAGEVRQALADGHQAAKLAVLTGSLKNRMAASLCLAKCYEVSGDPREAYNYLSQATRLKDSIYSIEKYRTIEEIEANFKQSELKKENEILIQNNLLQQQAMRTKNLVLTLLCISLVLSAIIIRMIYKRQMQTKRDASRMKQVSDQRIEKLNEDLTTKVRELTSKTIFINQKNQLLEKLIAELDDIKDNDITAASIQQLQTRLKHELSPNAWKEFEVQFNEVHPGFQQRLLEKFPDLTPAERRLCSFIRLDMNTREISSLSGQSTKSIEVARSRIRKKLSISREQNLTNAIALI
jgi:tetratricopeptide (TPR) repeat protein